MVGVESGKKGTKCKINSKVLINQREGGVAGAKQNAEHYIFSLWREENYRLLVRVCLAGHKWRDLEIVGSMFRGSGDQGELIQW